MNQLQGTFDFSNQLSYNISYLGSTAAKLEWQILVGLLGFYRGIPLYLD